MVIFQFIFFAYILVNIWLVWWFWRNLKGSGWVRVAVCGGVTALACVYPLMFRSSGASMAELLLFRAGAVWAGTFLYTFMLTVLADVIRLLRRRWGKESPPPRYVCCGVVVVLSALISAAGMVNALHPVAREVDVQVEVDLPRLDGKEMTLAVVSDVHIGRLVSSRHVKRVVELLEPYKPDAVLFAGDVLDDHVVVDTETLRKLLWGLNCWGAPGNHEYYSGSLSESLKLIDEMGIRMLVDDYAVLGDSILVVGRDDYSAVRRRGGRASLGDILKRVPAEKRGLPLLVIDHQPNELREAEEAGAFLQVSGHTHKGQIWPGDWVVERLFEHPYGYFRRGKTQYVVSVGAGTWGPPIRNTARPEVVVMRLHFKSREKDQ